MAPIAPGPLVLRSCYPDQSFDSTKAPMLKSAELLGFWSLHWLIFLGNNS
jgi:hypothetical protein